jgi:cobalamin biosynthesis protein CobT
MTLPRFLLGWVSALLVCTCTGLAQAQPNTVQEATPYFHEAAQQYVAADLQRALATVNDGLRIAPDDARLQALREAIQQQRQRSGQGGGGQDDTPQSGQSPSDGSDQSGDNSQSQNGNTEQPNRSGEQPNDPSQGEGARGGDTADAPPPDAPPESESGPVAGQSGTQERPSLSQAQAARILRALESQEKQLLRQVLKRDRKPQRILKEW